MTVPQTQWHSVDYIFFSCRHVTCGPSLWRQSLAVELTSCVCGSRCRHMQPTCLLHQLLQQRRSTGLDRHLMSASPTLTRPRSISIHPLSNQVQSALHES